MRSAGVTDFVADPSLAYALDTDEPVAEQTRELLKSFL